MLVRTLLPSALFTCSFLLLSFSGVAMAERSEPKVHGVFDGDEMYTLLEPDAIPAITSPEYVTGDEAAAQMLPDEPVIGVAIGEDAVCWSAWQLDHHEIVDDYIGETPIAATW